MQPTSTTATALLFLQKMIKNNKFKMWDCYSEIRLAHGSNILFKV